MTNLVLNTQNSTPYNTAINKAIKTMSSREIAELTGKDHRHVKRDIEVMFEQLNLDPRGYAQTWTHPQNGQTYEEYALDKDLSFCLVSGYNVQLRMAIIKRWTELETQVQHRLPTNFKEALQFLIVAEEEKEQLALTVAQKQLVIEEQQVDVDALERIASRKGSMTMRDAAKLLNMRQVDLRDWMLTNKWTYSPYKDNYRPMSAYATAGHLTLSANDYKPLVRVTWKGLALLAKRLNVTLDTDNI